MTTKPQLPTVPPARELSAATTAELRAELARGLVLTAEHLLRLGMIWGELERRGEDLSDLREGLAEWLPKIATGRLAAEAVVAFATKRMILRALEGVPLDRQRALAAGEPVEVIDPNTTDGTLSAPLARLPAAAIRLVFADGEIRSAKSQRLALRPRQRRAAEPEEADRHYQPRYDRAAGVLRIGRMTVRLSDLLAELNAAAGPDLPAIIHKEEYVVVKIRLTPEENNHLQESARQAGLPDWEMARKAMRALGLI